jgi:hypothetical protein
MLLKSQMSSNESKGVLFPLIDSKNSNFSLLFVEMQTCETLLACRIRLPL